MSCEQCGAQNTSGDSFCGTCGAYLEWSETTEPTQQAAAVAPGPPQPDAEVRQPQVAAVPPPVPPAPAPVPAPGAGDLTCPRCGEGNDPARSFCRRCGTALGVRTVAAGTSWWRRLRPSRRTIAAGERRRRGRLPRVRLWVMVLAGLVVLGFVVPLRGVVGDAVTAVRDTVTAPAPLDPEPPTASSVHRSHPPGLTVDGARNTYWAPAAGRAAGEFIEYGFAEPVRLAAVLISPGAGGRKDVFLTQARPRKVQLSWSGPAGVAGSRTYDLVDEPSSQELRVSADDVQRLRITVLSSYGARQDRHVAVGEVEFFARR